MNFWSDATSSNNDLIVAVLNIQDLQLRNVSKQFHSSNADDFLSICFDNDAFIYTTPRCQIGGAGVLNNKPMISKFDTSRNLI